MEPAVLANIFLFLGALGLNIGIGGSDENSDDSANDNPQYNPQNYAHAHDGTDGDDTVTADADNQAWFLHDGNDDLTASSGNDYANLGDDDDHAVMGAGNDIGLGGAGNDSLGGGVGADSLFGGAGNDHLQGNLGDDGLAGGDGNDEIWGGLGSDVLNGGAGDDTLSGFVTGAAGAGGMTGAEGSDQLLGGDGNDLLVLGHGDIGQGGAGNDIFNLDTRWDDGTAIAHITDFNAAQDALHISYTPHYSSDSSVEVPPVMTLTHTPDGSTEIRMDGAVVAQLDGVDDFSLNDIVLVPDAATDTQFVSGHYSDDVQGSDGSDTFAGSSDPTAWHLAGGADHLTGSSGADYADLGAGNDHAALGDGNDSVLGHAGDDSIDGGAGADTLRGGDGMDTLHGGDGADRMAGDSGNDLMAGGAGADSLLGGGGDDTLSGYSDTHSAEASLTAIDGTDTLSGGDGNDTLIIGHGDTATGGTGADRFEIEHQWADGAAAATITDYVFQTDQLELHYTPHFDADHVEIPPVVSIAQSAGFSVISVDGVAVANVMGARAVGLGEVVLVREG
ncbi:MAG: calcium-binding protein [Pseudomonadota bacterium]